MRKDKTYNPRVKSKSERVSASLIDQKFLPLTPSAQKANLPLIDHSRSHRKPRTRVGQMQQNIRAVSDDFYCATSFSVLYWGPCGVETTPVVCRSCSRFAICSDHSFGSALNIDAYGTGSRA
jgi:hypothetical protein